MAWICSLYGKITHKYIVNHLLHLNQVAVDGTSGNEKDGKAICGANKDTVAT